MKKITLLLLLVFSQMGYSQQKTTGVLSFSNMTAALLLDNSTQMVTLQLSGPNDRWFALQFGAFSGGMQAGTDLVYWNGSTLVDARQNGVGQFPSNDPVNNWVLVSNTNDSPSTGLRTLVYSRPFNTGDTNDYTFNFNNNTIDLAWARMNTASFALNYHGPNRGELLNTQLTTLDVEEVSMSSTQLYPNPTTGIVMISTQSQIDKIDVYNQIGALVRSIEVNNNNGNFQIDLSGVSSGIYLLELKNTTDKVWKKLIVN